MTGVIQGKSSATATPAGKVASQRPDQVALSGGNEEIGRLNVMMQHIPDNSSEKIPVLKQLINEGAYQPEARDVAEKMLDRWKDFTPR